MSNVEIAEMTVDPKFGVVLEFVDHEAADAFDDYLTEKRFVLFKLQQAPGGLRFLFGEASTTDQVSALLRDFMRASEVHSSGMDSGS